VSCAKEAKPIEMPYGEQTYVVASNLALDGGLDPPKEVSL